MHNIISFFDLNSADTAASLEARTRAPSIDEARARFVEAAQEVGLVLGEGFDFAETSDIVRCSTVEDKRGKQSGWYVIHKDQELYYGAVGNWHADGYLSFTGRDRNSIDDDQLRRIEIAQEMRKRDAEAERSRKAGEVAKLIETLPPAAADHPYLVAKGIRPNGALAYGQDLLLPIRDVHGNVVSMQTIEADGTKTFRAGCTSKGVYVIGGPTMTAVICEGFATGASIHEATGLRVYVTFNCGTMAALTPEIAMAEAAHGTSIVIAADHDHPSKHSPNIGWQKAMQAADSIGGAPVLMPPFVGSDWNDVAKWRPQMLEDAFAAVSAVFLDCDFTEEDERNLEDREWLYGTHYIRKYCSITIAPPGLGKSTLALAEAVAMATGRNILGIQPAKKLRWVYYNAEDPISEIKARLFAVCRAYGIPLSELKGQLFIQSGRKRRINLAVGEKGDIVETAFQLVAGFVKFYKCDGITLDPLANMTDAPESNDVFRRLGARLSLLADELNISVELVHHTRKLGGRQAEVEDSRGGSALIGAVRVARVLNPMEPDEAAKYGLDTAIDHFRVDAAGKNNLARATGASQWYERKGTQILNGGWVAVAHQWEAPDPFDDVTVDDAAAVQRAIAEAEEPRLDIRSSNWAGTIIADLLGLDVTEPAEKNKAKQLLAVWIKKGVLKTRKVRDSARGKDIVIVEVGDTNMRSAE